MRGHRPVVAAAIASAMVVGAAAVTGSVAAGRRPAWSAAAGPTPTAAVQAGAGERVPDARVACLTMTSHWRASALPGEVEGVRAVATDAIAAGGTAALPHAQDFRMVVKASSTRTAGTAGTVPFAG